MNVRILAVTAWGGTDSARGMQEPTYHRPLSSCLSRWHRRHAVMKRCASSRRAAGAGRQGGGRPSREHSSAWPPAAPAPADGGLAALAPAEAQLGALGGLPDLHCLCFKCVCVHIVVALILSPSKFCQYWEITAISQALSDKSQRITGLEGSFMFRGESGTSSSMVNSVRYCMRMHSLVRAVNVRACNAWRCSCPCAKGVK